MKAETTATQSWDDIVFEGRNKGYGAYYLRKTYEKHATTAAVIALIISILFLAYPTIAEFFRGDEDIVAKPKVMKTVSLEQPPPLNPEQPPPPNIPPPPVKTIVKFLPPKVVEKEVVEEEKMPTIDEIKNVEVGSENVEGTGDIVFDEPVQEVVADNGDANKVFISVEQQAEFPGGYEALAKWLGKNLKYPRSAQMMGNEGKTYVKFIVESDGSITHVEVTKGFDGACDREAMRVVSMMPKWKAGKQGGRAVRSYFTLPVVFRLNQ